MTTSTKNTLNLKPRAIAVLVALSSGPLTTSGLRLAIGPERKSDPNGLLRSMRDDHRLVTQRPHDDRWYLTHEGLGWLQSHGMDAVPEARAWHHDEMMASTSAGALFYQMATEIKGAAS